MLVLFKGRIHICLSSPIMYLRMFFSGIVPLWGFRGNPFRPRSRMSIPKSSVARSSAQSGKGKVGPYRTEMFSCGMKTGSSQKKATSARTTVLVRGSQ